MSQLEEKAREFWIYTHQGDENHNCAYEVGKFKCELYAQVHMKSQQDKGYICWGLKPVSEHYTLSNSTTRREKRE